MFDAELIGLCNESIKWIWFTDIALLGMINRL